MDPAKELALASLEALEDTTLDLALVLVEVHFLVYRYIVF